MGQYGHFILKKTKQVLFIKFVFGPQWFTLYTLPIRDIILNFNLNNHVYAADTQLYITFKSFQENANASIARRWTQQNFLKLNDGQSSFYLGHVNS